MTHALLPGSPAIDKGSNPANLLTDQRGLNRNNGGVDIGAFELQTTPAQFSTMHINNGAAQRSRVTQLLVFFDNAPIFAGNPADAFQLKRQSDNANVIVAASVDSTTVMLTFVGGAVNTGSLADGLYTLKILASQITNFDGDFDGNIGGDFTLVGTPSNTLFRLFGDANGDGSVTAIDFNAFRLAYGSAGSSIFDFNGDNQVTAADFNQFRLRYGVTLGP